MVTSQSNGASVVILLSNTWRKFAIIKKLGIPPVVDHVAGVTDLKIGEETDLGRDGRVGL